MNMQTRGLATILSCLALAALAAPRAASARTQLRNICTIYGQKETPIIGIGLVVGLARTGDGGKNAAAMRALASTLRYLNNPVESGKELADAANVAMVAISATVPKEGASNGQRLDCYVTSTFGAKSLKGGRLLISPIRLPNVIKRRRVTGCHKGSPPSWGNSLIFCSVCLLSQVDFHMR